MRFNGGIVRGVVGAVIIALLALSTGVVATAAPADQKLATQNPENWTPRVLDNRAYAVAQVGSRIVVGGNFTQIQPADTTKPVRNQASLFAFDATTGDIDLNFRPDVNGEVQAVYPHPDGNKVYIAGNFSQINGQRASRVALLNLVNGELVTTFDSTIINSEVNDIRLLGNRLYIGGDFTTVGLGPTPATRDHLAVLNATTGALMNRMKPVIAGTNNGGGTTVSHFDITADGTKLVAIGNFATVDGQPRNQIAMFDLTGTRDKLRAWSTTRYGNVCNPVFSSYMRDVDFSPDGSFFVVVTTGSYRFGQLCDTAARWTTNANKPDRQPTWTAYSGGDTFVSVEVTGPVAYVGGHMRWVNNPFAGDKAGSGAVPREGLAALDTRNGLPFSWDPTRARGYGVFDFFPSATHLWAVSDTNIWAGETRERLAGFPFAGGITIPPDRIGSLPGEVLLMGRLSGTAPNKLNVVAFDGTSVNEVTQRPAAEQWSQARGAFMVDNQVFTGWSNGTFKVRTFDGLNWGPSQNIPLYAGDSTTAGYPSNFINDVDKLTGIFYEPVDSRIYYTVAGDTRLMWRHFTPESRIVGAQRNFATNVSGLSPSKVRGMFLVGTDLYFADSTNGVLKKISFNRGTLGNTASVVNNEINWRAPGMALSTQPSSTGPNDPPVAAFTNSCTGLACSFDGTTSSDPDGSIADYAWDFGDGTQGSGPTVDHSYLTAGDYTVTLTVTDNRGDTDVATQVVSVAPISSSVEFRAATKSADSDDASSMTVTVPGAVQEGDLMVMIASNGGDSISDGNGGFIDVNGVPQAPAGWTLLDSRADSELRSDVFWKVATADDLGQQVTVTIDDGFGGALSTSTTLHLAAYSGVGAAGISAYSSATEDSLTAVSAHSTPAVTVPAVGSYVLSYWTDKTSSLPTPPPTTSWTLPIGQVGRGQVINLPNNNRVTAVLTDDGTPSAAGFRDGLTATTDGTTRKAIGWTIVLAPS